MMKFSKHFFKDISSLIAFAYIVLLFVVYPLYMKKEGYVGIDIAKYEFLLYTALGAIVLLLLFGMSELINSLIQKRFGIINAGILIFSVITLISYGLSEYKSNALIGASGWFMGLVTILIMCVLSFLISLLFIPKDYVWYPILGGSAIVFILGILDRFSIYIINLSDRNSSFISTIGNINWFTGYYSVVAPIGVFLLMFKFTECKNTDVHTLSGTEKCKIWLLIIYVVIAFAAGFLQGAESVLLVFIALFVGSFVLWCINIISFESFLSMMFLWGISGQIVKVLRYLLQEGYNYETTGVLSNVQVGTGTLIVAILSVIGIYHYKKSERKNKDKIIRIMVIVMLCLISIAYVVVGIMNTAGLLPRPLPYSLFLFDERFGSGRGYAYKAAIDGLKNMSVKQLIFGVGPDSFSAYAYTVPAIRDELYSVWGDLPLHNTHCEMLTMLINEGILGVLSYLGIFVCVFVTFIKKCRKPQALCISLTTFCYLVHNLVSFSQELNTPLLFILIGIGNGYCLNDTDK